MEKNNMDTASVCGGCSGAVSVQIDRRTFLTGTVLAAAAVALAACAAGDMTGPTSINSTVKISDHPELATVGGIATFSLSGTPIAIVRTDTSAFVALSRICPHQGSTIGRSGNGFMCPNHGSQYNQTGGWTGGQPTSNMRSYPVTYDATAGTLKIG